MATGHQCFCLGSSFILSKLILPQRTWIAALRQHKRTHYESPPESKWHSKQSKTIAERQFILCWTSFLLTPSQQYGFYLHALLGKCEAPSFLVSPNFPFGIYHVCCEIKVPGQELFNRWATLSEWQMHGQVRRMSSLQIKAAKLVTLQLLAFLCRFLQQTLLS